MNFVFLKIKIFKIIILGLFNLKMATIGAKRRYKLKVFFKFLRLFLLFIVLGLKRSPI